MCNCSVYTSFYFVEHHLLCVSEKGIYIELILPDQNNVKQLKQQLVSTVSHCFGHICMSR